MHIYVAAPYGRGSEVLPIHADIKARGHDFTSEWALHAHKPDALPKDSPEVRHSTYRQNIECIRRADITVAVVYPGEGKEMFCEAAVTMFFGYDVYWIGKEEHMPLSAFQPLGRGDHIFETWEAFADAILGPRISE